MTGELRRNSDASVLLSERSILLRCWSPIGIVLLQDLFWFHRAEKAVTTARLGKY